MPQFALICRDKPGGLPLRQQTRERHLYYIKENSAAVLLAGPLLNEKGEPIGSLLVIEAEDAAKAKDFAKSDPYAVAGLFEDVEIRPYQVVTGALAPKPA
ncbi:YciI family protein [Hyphococcus sp.]|uniref:YciI family protein n=1 Tax=Hyphococcus sp. TaxID=2038636 RepID=UPI003CCC4544